MEGMLFLYETLLRGAVKDYYQACYEHNLKEVERLEDWFRNEDWVFIYCGLKGIDVEILLDKTQELASR